LRHGVNLDCRSKAGELASELHRSANILSATLNAMSDFVLIVACADLRAVHVMRCLPWRSNTGTCVASIKNCAFTNAVPLCSPNTRGSV